jgi:hypothetical protein
METQERAAVLTGKEGAEIEVTVASNWTKNHRHRNPGGVVSQFFGREILERILQQPGCVGLRIYYANSKPLSGWQRFVKRSLPKYEGEVHLVLAGVTSDGTDQIPGSGPKLEAFALQSNTVAATSSTTILGEQSVPCPGGVGCPSNVLTGGA